MKTNLTTPADSINLVLKVQLTAICDHLKKPKKDISVEALRTDLTAARETLEKAEKLKIDISDDTMNLLPVATRIHFLDHFLQCVFASFPK